MTQVKCTDCGENYAATERSCPNCGCPNDNWQPQQEPQPTEEPTVDYPEEDFNESRQYSPFSPKSWFFSTPWPLASYPNRKDFEKAHPFLGWLFNPWYLTCKNDAEKEEYATINNIFYLFNLIFKTQLYAALWAFIKGFFLIVAYYLLTFSFGYISYHVSSDVVFHCMRLIFFVVMFAVCILLAIIYACGMGKALHRYWPSIHRTWRRLNARYWRAMNKAAKK